MIMLAILSLLAAADVATTAYGLAHGAAEANPIFSRLFSAASGWKLVVLMAALKLCGLAVSAALLLLYPSWWPVGALYAVSLAFVIRANIRVIRSL